MHEYQVFGAVWFTVTTLAMIVVLVLCFKDSSARVISKIGWCLWTYGFALFALAFWLWQVVDFPFLLKMSAVAALAVGLILSCVDDMLDTVQVRREARAARTTQILAPQDPQ